MWRKCNPCPWELLLYLTGVQTIDNTIGGVSDSPCRPHWQDLCPVPVTNRHPSPVASCAIILGLAKLHKTFLLSAALCRGGTTWTGCCVKGQRSFSTAPCPSYKQVPGQKSAMLGKRAHIAQLALLVDWRMSATRK